MQGRGERILSIAAPMTVRAIVIAGRIAARQPWTWDEFRDSSVRRRLGIVEPLLKVAGQLRGCEREIADECPNLVGPGWVPSFVGVGPGEALCRDVRDLFVCPRPGSVSSSARVACESEPLSTGGGDVREDVDAVFVRGDQVGLPVAVHIA